MTRGPEECKQPHALARLQYESIRNSRGILRSPGAAHASFLVCGRARYIASVQ